MKVRKEGRQVKKKPADKEKNKIFKVVLAGERVFSNAKEAFTLYDSSRLGEPKEGKVYYSLF